MLYCSQFAEDDSIFLGLIDPQQQYGHRRYHGQEVLSELIQQHLSYT